MCFLVREEAGGGGGGGWVGGGGIIQDHFGNIIKGLYNHLLSLTIDSFVCSFGFLTSSSTTRLYRGRVPRLTSDNFTVLLQTRQSWETMTSVSAGHIILTLTQPVGGRRSQRESNPGPPHLESPTIDSDTYQFSTCPF